MAALCWQFLVINLGKISKLTAPSAIAKYSLTLSQSLGIPLVKDSEELLAQIQATLEPSSQPYPKEETL